MSVAEAEQHEEEAATLPAGWRPRALSELAQVIAGQSPPGHTYRKRPEGLPFFQGKADFGPRHPIARVWCVEPNKIAQPGDILISVRAPVGPTNVADQECCIGRGLAAIRVGPEADPDFLLYFLRLFEATLARKGSGSTFGAINRDTLESIVVPTPPLGEQRRIAAALRERMQTIERARTATEEQCRAARRLPVAELNSLLDALSPYPTRSLPELADFLPAKSIATDGDAQVTAITTACLSELFFDSAGLKRARMHSHDVPDCIVRPGEVLIARSNTPGLVGRATLFTGTPSPVVASDLTIRLWARSGINPAYLARFFSCRFVTGYWKERAGGASGSMKKITRGQLLTELVPVPPEAEQGRFADQVASRLRSAQRLLSSLAGQRTTIDLLPAALLRDAFSGRL